MKNNPSSKKVDILPGNIFKKATLDERGRFHIPASIQHHLNIQDGHKCILAIDNTSLHIVLDSKQYEKILKLNPSEVPAYEQRNADSTKRILFGSDLLNRFQKDKKNRTIYYCYHNGVIDVFFNEEEMEKEQQRQFTNTQKMFRAKQQQKVTGEEVNQIYSAGWNPNSIKWNIDSYKPPIKKEPEKK